MLELKDITFGVEGKPGILKGISMTFRDGETVVITGPNGGGKTSLAKVIAGVVTPDGGQIVINGKDMTDQGITERAKAGVAYAFQQPVRFKGVTARDLLNLAANRTLSDQEVTDYLRAVGLSAEQYIDREVDAKLSGGEIKRIEIATIMARDANIYVFDEPEAGIDLWSFKNLIEVFSDLRQDPKDTIIIISHQERIMEIADRIAVIAGGELAAFGPGNVILPALANDPTCRSCGESCLVQEEA